MSKHHDQSKAEQINNKAHDAVTFHCTRNTFESNWEMRPEHAQKKAARMTDLIRTVNNERE